MLNTVLLIDLSNLIGQCREVGRRPNLPALKDRLANPAEGRHEVDSYVYAQMPQSNGDGVRRYHNFLRSQGFQVVTKRAKQLPDGRFKCNLDAEMTMDALELAQEIRPDVIVLVTGDGDFAPLALRLRRKGVRVEVASLQSSMANELRLACRGYIDLSDWVDDCERIGDDAPAVGGDDVFAERL